MYRGLCWLVAAAVLMGGCARKDGPYEVQTAEATPSADQPTEDDSPVAPVKSEHPIVAVTREFFTASAAGNFSRALALSVPGDITGQGLAGMRAAFSLEQATFAQAWVGAEQAAVITDFLPAQHGSARAAWAINLIVTEDGRWLVRLSDILFNEQMVEDYLAAFHEVAPNADWLDL